ncbi:MAG TPA: tubulin-like doman-containing protein, partial [Ignavibacteria bacterium]
MANNKTQTEQTVLKRSVFIGIGGTGRDAIIFAKKKIQEIYNETPNLFSFLVIDTEAPKITDDNVRLEPNEYIYAKVGNINDLLNNQNHIKNAIPEQILKKARNLTDGAGQIRGLGRIALLANYNDIRNQIKKAIDKVKDWKITDSQSNYKAIDNNVNIHMVFSLSGGTGSGMFLDIAYIIRDLYKNEPADYIFAYIMLPGIFESLPGTNNVGPNCYGALKEIDYFMNLSSEDKFKFDYGNGETIVAKNYNPPFDIIYLINNVNKDGDIYQNVSDLTNFIGNTLYLQAGSMGKVGSSVFDNIKSQVLQKSKNGKSQHYLGFGISELYYNGDKLAELATARIAVKLIEKYKNITGNRNISESVDSFISSTKIKEDDNRDDIIDAILEIKNILPEQANKNAGKIFNQIDGIIGRYKQKVSSDCDTRISENYKLLLTDRFATFNKFINDKLLEEGGLDFTKEFLIIITGKVKAYKNMMIDEKNEFETKIKEIDIKIKQAKDCIKELEDKSLIFNKEQKLNANIQSFNNILSTFGKYIQERTQREQAMAFYSELLELIDKRISEISKLSNLLDTVNKNFHEIIESIIINRKEAKPFMVHLSNDLIDGVSEGNINWNDFINY